MAPRSSWLFVLPLALGCSGSDRPAGDPSAARAERVVEQLRPAIAVKGAPLVTYRLGDRMTHFRAPGVSIAVADSGRIVWAKGFGLKEAGTADSVTPATLFQAASISKPVAATAMLRLVEQGKLALDENVNSYLKSWKVPDNRFTAKEKVTLRRIVSHNAGLTVHGFPGYAVTDSMPTVPQILDGVKPANTAAVRVDTFPGAIWRYAGGGTTVMQLALTDVSGTPFPVLAQQEVLGPISMTSSTYEQPISATRRSETAAAHDGKGEQIPGRWHVYPEMAAAGLWTTPTDLLKWAVAIGEARAGKPNGILSQAMATQMLTEQKAPTGLGPFLEGQGKAFNFGHGGSNEGFRSQVIYFPETGQGAAVMVNADGGSALIQEILNAIAAEYGWAEYGPREVTPIPMDSAALARFVGSYEVVKPFPLSAEVTAQGARLFVEMVGRGPIAEAVFTGPTTIVSLDEGIELTFEVDASGRATSIGAGPMRLTRKR